MIIMILEIIKCEFEQIHGFTELCLLRTAYEKNSLVPVRLIYWRLYNGYIPYLTLSEIITK